MYALYVLTNLLFRNLTCTFQSGYSSIFTHMDTHFVSSEVFVICSCEKATEVILRALTSRLCRQIGDAEYSKLENFAVVWICEEVLRGSHEANKQAFYSFSTSHPFLQSVERLRLAQRRRN